MRKVRREGCTGAATRRIPFLVWNNGFELNRSARSPNEKQIVAASNPTFSLTIPRVGTQDGEILEMPAITLVDRIRMCL